MPRSRVIGRMMGSANAASGWDLLTADDIRQRPGGDLRPAVAEHVLAMAETICAIGLLHPVVVDRERRLLAGLHRVAAFRLLGLPSTEARIAHVLDLAGLEPDQAPDALPPRGQDLVARVQALDLDRFRQLHPEGRIPTRIRSDLDAETQPDAARQAEVAENDVRRDFTRQEIQAYARQLRAAGYDDRPGRPKTGTRALVPALVGIVGKSRRTIMRILAEERAGEEGAPAASPADRQRRSWTALRRAVERARELEPDAELDAALAQVADLLDQRLAATM